MTTLPNYHTAVFLRGTRSHKHAAITAQMLSIRGEGAHEHAAINLVYEQSNND